MRVFLSVLLLFLPLLSWSKDVVAVIGTGLDLEDPRFKPYLCETGHKSFNKEPIKDTDSHETHTTGLIIKDILPNKVCIVVIKFFSIFSGPIENQRNFIRALDYAVTLPNIQLVHYSGGGYGFDETEYIIIKKAINTLFVFSVGNDGLNIDLPRNRFYPASYNLPNIVSVGALDKNGNVHKHSNYGKSVKVWEPGQDIVSFLPNGKTGKMTGTSMSAAIFTNKFIKRVYGSR